MPSICSAGLSYLGCWNRQISLRPFVGPRSLVVPLEKRRTDGARVRQRLLNRSPPASTPPENPGSAAVTESTVHSELPDGGLTAIDEQHDTAEQGDLDLTAAEKASQAADQHNGTAENGDGEAATTQEASAAVPSMASEPEPEPQQSVQLQSQDSAEHPPPVPRRSQYRLFPYLSGSSMSVFPTPLTTRLRPLRRILPRAWYAALISTTTTVLAIVTSRRRFLETVNYQLLKLLSLPTLGKVLATVAFTLPVILLGAVAYSRIASKPWNVSVHRSYLAVTAFPDYWGMEKHQPSARLLVVLHVMGLFTFASIIGVLTNDARTAMDRVNQGKFGIHEEGHTVLLGWNHNTIHLIKQILLAQDHENGAGSEAFGLPIVILAQKDKLDMDKTLALELGVNVAASLTVMARSGSPLSLPDLQQVSVGSARTVLIMKPDSGELPPETQVTATLANLKMSLGHERPPQQIILESDGEFEDSAALVIMKHMTDTQRFTFTSVQSLENVAFLMAQCAIQPGLGDVLHQMATFDGCEFYVHQFPHLCGCTFGNARQRFDRASVCGIINNRTGEHQLNPADDLVLGPDDALLLLARSAREALLLQTPLEVAPMPPHSFDQEAASASVSIEDINHHIFVISHTAESKGLVSGLVEFAAPGTFIKVLTDTKTPGSDQVKGSSNARVVYEKCAVHSTQALVKADICNADSIVILLGTDQADGILDAQVVTSIYLIQGALSMDRSSNKAEPLEVVCCVTQAATTAILHDVAASSQHHQGSQSISSMSQRSVHGQAEPDPPVAPSRGIKLDILQYRQLFAGILTMLAAEPRLQPVFLELFEGGSNKVGLQRPQAYGLVGGQEYQWGQLQDLVKSQGELLLGYVSRFGSASLAPPRSSKIKLLEGQRLAVLTKSSTTTGLWGLILSTQAL